MATITAAAAAAVSGRPRAGDPAVAAVVAHPAALQLSVVQLQKSAYVAGSVPSDMAFLNPSAWVLVMHFCCTSLFNLT